MSFILSPAEYDLHVVQERTRESAKTEQPGMSKCRYCLLTHRGGRPFVKNGVRKQYGRQAKIVLWEAAHGPIPEGYHLYAMCDRAWCVNIEHMALFKSNAGARIRKFLDWCAARGENPLTFVRDAMLHLTADLAQSIRSWAKRVTNRRYRYGEEPPRQRREPAIAPPPADEESLDPPPSIEEMEEAAAEPVPVTLPCYVCGRLAGTTLQQVLLNMRIRLSREDMYHACRSPYGALSSLQESVEIVPLCDDHQTEEVLAEGLTRRKGLG